MGGIEEWQPVGPKWADVSSFSSVCSTLGKNVNYKLLGRWSHPYSIAGCRSHSFCLGLLCSMLAAFFSGQSMFLASPTSWDLHCTFTASYVAPEGHTPGFPGLLIKADWKPPCPTALCAYKTRIPWMIPRSSTQLSSSQNP